MEVIELDPLVYPRRTSEISLWFMGDLHRSALGCDVEQWKADIEAVRQDPLARVILMGDLFNCVHLAHRHFDFEDIHRDFKTQRLDRLINQELDAVTEELRPIAHKVLVALTGNHDERSRRYAGIDIHYELCKRLRIPNGGYSTAARWTLKRGERTGRSGESWAITLFLHHGFFGGGRMRGGEANALLRAMQDNDADINAFGHSHGRGHQVMAISHIPKVGALKVIPQQRVALSTGSYLDKSRSGGSNYAEERNLPNPIRMGGRRLGLVPGSTDTTERRVIKIEEFVTC